MGFSHPTAAARLVAAWRARPSRRDLVTMVPGQLLRERGDLAGAWGFVRQLLPAGRDTPPGDTVIFETLPLLRLGTALALDAGDLPLARAWLDTHDHWLVWSGAVLGQAEAQLGWAAYHRAAGDLASARQAAGRALAHAAEPRQPLALLAARRTLGELDTEAGGYATAATHLAEALTLADACAAPYERALTLLARAEFYAATGDRPAALADLAAVTAICTPLEARPALARAEALAARLGDAG